MAADPEGHPGAGLHVPGLGDAIQVKREQAQRDVALGRRVASVLGGFSSPVLKRWITSAIIPVSARLRAALEVTPFKASLLGSPVFGLPEIIESKHLGPVLQWAFKRDHLDDLVLSVLGTAISRILHSSHPQLYSTVLMEAGSKARETALAQFLQEVQGAKAMSKIRRATDPAWKQHNRMNVIASVLLGPVRSALLNEPVDEAVHVGGPRIVTILTPKGEERRIKLRPPEDTDWAFLEVARQVQGEKDPHAATWASFSMVVLCAAQAEAGWFDLAFRKVPKAKTRRREFKAHVLTLSLPAAMALKSDLDTWLHMGFSAEPMAVKPVDGDYLTVKHRPVAGARGPMGIKTNAKDSPAWQAAVKAIAETEWAVHTDLLRLLKDSEFVQELALKSEPDELRRQVRINAYSACASQPVYFPIVMDFRGRVYLRPQDVTYQGTDMQKALLCWPGKDWQDGMMGTSEAEAVSLHLTNLYGGYIAKASLGVREAWCNSALQISQGAFRYAPEAPLEQAGLRALLREAKKPLQFLAALLLISKDAWNRIPVQMDGTCNGLQHLTALFRDDTAAPFVNLCAGPDGDGPQDLYGAVAGLAGDKLFGYAYVDDAEWATRLQRHTQMDRDLCKPSVMVLPYGGTLGTIQEETRQGLLEQEIGQKSAWTLGISGPSEADRYADWQEGNYGAFKDRPLSEHPLFRLDAQRLGTLIYQCIGEKIPKAMEAMTAFRAIAKAVGDRTLEWSTGGLWVVQAKAVSRTSSMAIKGIVLPGSVRGLKIHAGQDEIDAHSHVTGIVANFIHSLDAGHLARTEVFFQQMAPGAPFGANHDCFLTDPLHYADLAKATRKAFYYEYVEDPLLEPVRIRDVKGKLEATFPTWYALAEALGVSFPPKGEWEPEEVLESRWFFS